MKTRGLRMFALFLLMVGAMVVRGQGRDAEVPGDNFSLEGALELFKKSESPQEFEKMLNAQDSKVNNLDLNGDGYIDYIRVIDRNEGNIHTFTLQAVISDREVQDVAVIALEKKSNGKAVLQIIGDEDVYDMETIIEPTQDVRVNAGTSTTQTFANVWAWPSVQYVYSPSYVVWVSPWSWTMRPVGWYHWHPVVYYRYDSWWSPYRSYYAHCYSPRIVHASYIYRPYRTTSVIVYHRHERQIARYRSTHHNDYERSRSRYNDNDRYSNNERSDRQREGHSDRPTPRTRTNDEVAHNTRANDRSIERNNTPIQRERSESKPTERQRTSVEQPRKERSMDSNSQRNTPVQRERATSKQSERQHTAMEQPRNEHSQREHASGQSRSSERMSSSEKSDRSERSDRSSGHSNSSQSQGRSKRSK